MNKLYFSFIVIMGYLVANAQNHDYVEIGGVKWATMNIGATTVSGSCATCCGDYYPWGGLETYYNSITWDGHQVTNVDWKTDYSSGYAQSTAPYQTSNYAYSKYNSTDNLTTLESEDDVATQKWGKNWRMPTITDFRNLCMACGVNMNYSSTVSIISAKITTGGIYWLPEDQTYESEYTGVSGVLFVSTEDNTKRVFFPSSGGISGKEHKANTSLNTFVTGYYWTSTLASSPIWSGQDFFFYGVCDNNATTSLCCGQDGRYYGRSVRAVYDPVEPAITRKVTSGTYEAFCLPFDVNVSDIRTSFDNIYCMTGDYVLTMPAFGEDIPVEAKVGKAKTATADKREEGVYLKMDEEIGESEDISSYEACQVPFALWQDMSSTGSGQASKKTFHVFMVGMPDTDIDGNDNVIPAGTPFYGIVKDGVTEISFSGDDSDHKDDKLQSQDLMRYNYQDGVSTKIIISEEGSISGEATAEDLAAEYEGMENPALYTFSASGAFTEISMPAEGETLSANKAYIFTSEPVDDIVVHYDKGTWGNGGWDTVVSMIKSATAGDVNRDGKVNIVDVTSLVKYLNDNESISIDKYAADVNSTDGNTPDATDVESIGNMIIGK